MRLAFGVAVRVAVFLPVDLRGAVLTAAERDVVFRADDLPTDGFAPAFFLGADFGADTDLLATVFRFGALPPAFRFAAVLAGAFAATVLAPAFFAPTVFATLAFLAAGFVVVVLDAAFLAADFLAGAFPDAFPDALRAGAFAAAFAPVFLPAALRDGDFAPVLRVLARMAKGCAPGISVVVSSVLTSDDSCSKRFCPS